MKRKELMKWSRTKLKNLFNRKKLSYDNGEWWCTGCDSYRKIPEHDYVGVCDVCTVVSQKKVLIYETFEGIMEKWDNTTHKVCTKKLPILKGTSNKGYRVRGFSYVSTEDYEKCSKLLWVRVDGYSKANYSKENRKRTKEATFHEKGKVISQQDFVLAHISSRNMIVDHINHFELDNRRVNLRLCSLLENNYNKSKYNSKHKGKYIGVDKIGVAETCKCWRVRLYVKGKRYTGSFRSEVEAAKEYNRLLRLHRPSKFNVYNKV